MTVYERDKIRQDLLVSLYNLVDGNQQKYVMFDELAKSIGIKRKEYSIAYDYLKDENLIKSMGMGYQVKITHYGIKAVESILRKIDLTEDRLFNNTELYQLNIKLDEIR